MGKKNVGSDEIIYDLHEYGINPSSREIFLHRYIHSDAETTGDCGIDHRMAVGFVKNLRFLDNQSNEPIIVHMQSRGGDWNDGIAIYDAIKVSVTPITIIAYAHARSMTSVILQAANMRILAPNCDVVIHQGWWGSEEDRVRGVMSQMEHEKRLQARMMEIYAERCRTGKFFEGQQRRTVIDYINSQLKERTDWIMTAEEAIHYGFADGVLGQKGFDRIGG